MKVELRAIEMCDDGVKHKLLVDIKMIQKLLDSAFQFTGFAIDIDPVQQCDSRKIFCECCGMALSRILEKLNTCEWKPINSYSATLVRTDGLHFQYEKDVQPDNFYSKRPILTCCEYCGVMLREEDTRGHWEIMGESGSRPERQYMTTGYVCHYCAHVEKY